MHATQLEEPRPPSSERAPSKARRRPRAEPIDIRYGTLFLPRGVALNLEVPSPRSRLIRRLVDAHRATPGLALTGEALMEEMWPGQELDESARVRLRVAVHRLRALGLPVLTIGSGYAIDPRARFV